MKEINFKLRVKILFINSCIGSLSLILSLILFVLKYKSISICLFLLYMCSLFISNVLWKCPNCKAKLPKGVHTNELKSCPNCSHDLN